MTQLEMDDPIAREIEAAFREGYRCLVPEAPVPDDTTYFYIDGNENVAWTKSRARKISLRITPKPTASDTSDEYEDIPESYRVMDELVEVIGKAKAEKIRQLIDVLIGERHG